MSRWTGRTISTVLVLGAVAVAGCGGSSGSSSSTAASGTSGSAAGTDAVSLHQDAQSVSQAAQTYRSAAAGLETNATEPASWQQASQGAKQASDSINGLNLPSSLQSAQKALVASLNSLSDSAGKVASDLTNKDASALQTDLAQAKAANQAYKQAGLEWAHAVKSAAGG